MCPVCLSTLTSAIDAINGGGDVWLPQVAKPVNCSGVVPTNSIGANS